MADHLFAVIDNPIGHHPIPRLIERVLLRPIHPHMPERNPRKLGELPGNATPVYARHRPKIRQHRPAGRFRSRRDLFRMKQLRKHPVRTLQSLGLAALRMHDGIRIVLTLNAGPTKCADLNGRGRHHNLERAN
jgi:hypothetical protein